MDMIDWMAGEARLPAPMTERELTEAYRRLREAAIRERTFASGETIRRHGGPCDGFHFVVSGVVHFVREDRQGPPMVFHVGLPGFWCGLGEVASRGGTRVALTALAASPTTIASIDIEIVERMIERDPVVRGFVDATLSTRFAALLDLVATGLKSDPAERLATRLLGFARLNTVPWSLPARMEIPLSQAVLSSLTGVSRQTVNRAMRQLVEAGAVQSIYGGVRIVDFERLAEVAGVQLLPGCTVREDAGARLGA